MKVLVTNRIYENSFDILKKRTNIELIVPQKDSFSKEELIEKIKDCEVLLSIFKVPIDKDIISAGEKLKMISNYGVGFNNIDIEYATSRGIVVTNTPKAVTEPTAELAFAMMHALCRRVVDLNKDIRIADKLKWGLMDNLSTTLYAKTLGVVGFGRIGQALARRALAAGMKVVYYSRNRVDIEIEKLYSAEYMSLNDLLKKADYVSLNVPLTTETKHLIAEKELQIMKKTAFIINTARGQVIDEQALANELKNNTIAGAGLDVFEQEPKINEELKKLENTILLPHVGTGTCETREATAIEACENIIKFIEGDKTLSRVN